MMQLRQETDEARTDWEVLEESLSLDGMTIVELGCGPGLLTRAIAGTGTGRQILALEVDEVQHARNARITDLPNVEFGLAGAESIPCDDGTVDLALMFKSLHHVPTELVDQAMAEIHRVLVPSGHLHVSEPVFDGVFNEVLRLFHDEERQRAAAFEALTRAVDRGLFELVRQTFFLAPVYFPSFEAFEHKIIDATHTEHRLSDTLHAQVKARFEAHLGAVGALFLQPTRVDLLRSRS